MLSDSSAPAQSSENVIGIYHPFREKKAKCEGYNIRELQDRARLIMLLKSRFGLADRSIMTGFYGETGIWKELPLPDKITDYSRYTKL